MHRHYYNLAEVHLNSPSVVTIGIFDGVHRGHRHLLGQLVNAARASGRQAVALTLFPHPDRVLHGQTGRYYLNTPEQKAELLHQIGVDVVITHPFDDSVRQVRAADFVDQLLHNLSMRSLWVTADFAMGHRREGNYSFLVMEGREKGFEVQQIDLLTGPDNAAISSTSIRQALLDGNLQAANDWLGYNYQLSGQVVHGDHRGRVIGYPTANIEVWDEQIIPANGIYACRARLGDKQYMAAANVGVRPTFDGQDIRVEAYLLDFAGEIYGQTLALDFVARLRGEERFNTLLELIAQIGVDVEQTRVLLGGA